MRPNVTDKDKLYLLRTTSSPEVRSFLDRQPVNTKTDYQRLRKALIKEFADPESDQGLVAALETRQGRHKPPQAYYSRLRQAYFGTRNDSDMEDELNFKTLFLRNLHPGISHHLGVLACPRTMNTQQLRDLVQKAYYKQKMASEKSAKTPAVLDFNTQHHELALEGTQRQDSAKPPHKEWNAPPSNRERDSHAGTRPKQRYDRWDGPRGRQCSPGRHWDKSWDQARPHKSPRDRSWNQPGSYGNSKGKQQTHPGAVSPRNRRKNSPRFQTDRVQTESTQEQETPPHFDSQKLMEMMVKEFFQRKEEDRKWEKKEKPDSAWLAVGRNGSDKLNKSATENTLTSDVHETPPENPATELNTNSTPNTPNHSSVQQTPADETPQVPESAVSVTCHSSEEHQISSDILNVFSQTPAPQMTKPMLSPQQVHYMKSHGHLVHPPSWQLAHTPALSCIAITPQFAADDLLAPKCGFVTTNHDSSHVKPIWTFHFLYGPEHILRAPHAPLCQIHAASARRCPHVCPWATHCATARRTSRPEGEYADTHDAPWWVASSNRQIQTTDRKRGKIDNVAMNRIPCYTIPLSLVQTL